MDKHFFKQYRETLEMVKCAISNQPRMVIVSGGKKVVKANVGKCIQVFHLSMLICH